MSFSRARLGRAIAAVSLAALIGVPAFVVTPAAAQPTPTAAPAATSSSLVVATFNVRCANCSKKPSNRREKRWETRAPVIVKQILGEGVDVLGVQEASPGLLGDRRTAQFEDLVKRLGAPYAVTDPSRYNCARTDTTFTRCGGFTDRGASQDARIIYRTDRLDLVRSGSLRLDGRSVGNGSARYMAWAEFTAPDGEHFLFATAHFEPGVSKKKTRTRVAQVKKAIARLNSVNSQGLPIIWASDLASSKLTHVGNKAYDAFRSAGFVDPLGNSYKAKRIPSSAHLTATTAKNEQYFTLNNFAEGPKDYVGRGYKLGAHLDYVLLKGGVRATSWEMVMNLNSRGDFAGVIPSDHSMVRATVTLS